MKNSIKGCGFILCCQDESIRLISGYPHGSQCSAETQSSRLTCGIYLQNFSSLCFLFAAAWKEHWFPIHVICSFHWFHIVFVASIITHINCINTRQTHNNTIIYCKISHNACPEFLNLLSAEKQGLKYNALWREFQRDFPGLFASQRWNVDAVQGCQNKSLVFKSCEGYRAATRPTLLGRQETNLLYDSSCPTPYTIQTQSVSVTALSVVSRRGYRTRPRWFRHEWQSGYLHSILI